MAIKRILVADDNEDARDIYKTAFLSVFNNQVDVAEDGAQAYEMAKSMSYDLLFLDHSMPKMSGMEVARKLKDEGYETKFVLASAYDKDTLDCYASKLGITDLSDYFSEIIQKPAEMDQILRISRRLHESR